MVSSLEWIKQNIKNEKDCKDYLGHGLSFKQESAVTCPKVHRKGVAELGAQTTVLPATPSTGEYETTSIVLKLQAHSLYCAS